MRVKVRVKPVTDNSLAVDDSRDRREIGHNKKNRAT